MPLEQIRKNFDIFVLRIKHKISFLLKNFDFQNEENFQLLKVQLEILSAYLQKINLNSIFIHIIFEFSEILIIIKRNLIEKINSFKFDFDLSGDYSERKLQNDEKENFNEKIPIKILEFFSIFVNLISILTTKSNLGKFFY